MVELCLQSPVCQLYLLPFLQDITIKTGAMSGSIEVFVKERTKVI
jgi:hypothetical protein